MFGIALVVTLMVILPFSLLKLASLKLILKRLSAVLTPEIK